MLNFTRKVSIQPTGRLSFGDGQPEISREEQQRQVVELTAQFLDSLKPS